MKTPSQSTQLSVFFFISSLFGRFRIGHKNKQDYPTLIKYCFHIFLAHPNLESTRNKTESELWKFSSLFFRPKRWRKHIWALGIFFQMDVSVVSLPANAAVTGSVCRHEHPFHCSACLGGEFRVSAQLGEARPALCCAAIPAARGQIHLCCRTIEVI